MKNQIIITQLSDTEYDVAMPAIKRDGHLRLEDGVWLLDVFNSALGTHCEASHLGDTMTIEDTGIVSEPDWNGVFNEMREA